MAQTGRGRRTDPDVRARIADLARLGWTASRIEEKLGADRDLQGRVPSLRTIQALVRPIRQGRKSETWSLSTAGGSEAQPVLAALRVAIQESQGQILSFDNHEADWISRIISAAPDIPKLSALLRALALAAIERDGASLEGTERALFESSMEDAERALQIFLAYRPWVDEGGAYVEARTSGVVPAPAQFDADPLGDPSVAPAFNSWLVRRAVDDGESQR